MQNLSFTFCVVHKNDPIQSWEKSTKVEITLETHYIKDFMVQLRWKLLFSKLNIIN